MFADALGDEQAPKRRDQHEVDKGERPAAMSRIADLGVFKPHGGIGQLVRELELRREGEAPAHIDAVGIVLVAVDGVLGRRGKVHTRDARLDVSHIPMAQVTGVIADAA